MGLHGAFRSVLQPQIGVVAACDDAAKTAFQTVRRLHCKFCLVADTDVAPIRKNRVWLDVPPHDGEAQGVVAEPGEAAELPAVGHELALC